MKTLTFKYQANLRESTKNALKKAALGQPQIFDDIIFFNDLEMVDSFINPMKAKILMAIKNNKPQSIYELAQVIQKDQGYVQREIKFLEGLGIISLEQKKDHGRIKNVPKLVYDRFVIDLGLSANSKKTKAVG